MELLGSIADYSIVDEGGFPQEDLRLPINMGASGACIVPNDLQSNVEWLHHFLFEDEEYTVSDTLLNIDAAIENKVRQYQN